MIEWFINKTPTYVGTTATTRVEVPQGRRWSDLVHSKIFSTYFVAIEESGWEPGGVVGSENLLLSVLAHPLAYEVVVGDQIDAYRHLSSVHQLGVDLSVADADTLRLERRQVGKL